MNNKEILLNTEKNVSNSFLVFLRLHIVKQNSLLGKKNLQKFLRLRPQ